MYLEKTNSQGKYTCYLLRETYRQDGKVKHRTIANLSGAQPKRSKPSGWPSNTRLN
jgi:hypothetical protein